MKRERACEEITRKRCACARTCRYASSGFSYACVHRERAEKKGKGIEMRETHGREGEGARCGTRERERKEEGKHTYTQNEREKEREMQGGGSETEEWEIIKMAARATYSTSYSSASPPPPVGLRPLYYSSTLSERARRAAPRRVTRDGTGHGAVRKPPGVMPSDIMVVDYRDSLANR